MEGIKYIAKELDTETIWSSTQAKDKTDEACFAVEVWQGKMRFNTFPVKLYEEVSLPTGLFSGFKPISIKIRPYQQEGG
ncbi:MAG TPA: hypothetical protein VFF49_09820 [Thermodesulfobacteriota bacterium]|nr:hypothetical protein [Thermodesulfobacteriota bacterium]